MELNKSSSVSFFGFKWYYRKYLRFIKSFSFLMKLVSFITRIFIFIKFFSVDFFVRIFSFFKSLRIYYRILEAYPAF